MNNKVIHTEKPLTLEDISEILEKDPSLDYVTILYHPELKGNFYILRKKEV